MKTKAQVNDFLSKVKEVEELAKSLEVDKIKKVTKPNQEGSHMSHPVVGASSDEQRALRAFGCKNVKDLLKVNTGHPHFSKVAPELKHLVRELKKDFDTSRAISQMFFEEAKDHFGETEATDRIQRCKSIMSHNYGKDVLASRIKAFGSTVVGAGDEWVPTAIAESYIEEYELEYAIERQFRDVPMPTNPFKMPAQDGKTKARRVSEGGTATGSNFGTKTLDFDCVKSVEFYELPEELTEDSAVDFISAGRIEVVAAQIRAIEDALINGDSDGTHQDSDTQAAGADVAAKFWDGLRKRAIANSANGGTVDFAGGTVTEAKLREMRANMGKFGVNPRELMWVPGPAVLQQMLALPSVATIDKYGPMATVIAGSLANYQGIPIVVSEEMRELLNDNGVYDGVTTTKGGLLLVNVKRFMTGRRRPIVIKAQYALPAQDKFLLASYQRRAFTGFAQGANETSVVYGVDVLV